MSALRAAYQLMERGEMQMSPTRVIAAAEPSAFAAPHESLLITPLHTEA